MLRNYFIIAWRNLRNNLLFAGLNSIGLSIGMAACLVTGLFAYEQYHYDAHHAFSDRIYRVVNKQFQENRSTYVALTQGVLAAELKKSFAEVEEATRIGFKQLSINRINQDPVQVRVMAVDSTFFSVFTIPFAKRASQKLLKEDEIYLSEKITKTIFGDKNPIGETISFVEGVELKVAGIFNDFPYQSNLSADYIISFYWLEKLDPQSVNWHSNTYFNYVLMRENTDIQDFGRKMNELIHRFTPTSWSSYEFFLQPLLTINLQPAYVGNSKGSIGKILVNGFMMVSLIILLLASFNYMNMATARSVRRATEVGVRKAVGAQRFQVIKQFLMESLILCAIAFFISVLWADIGLQYFNYFTGFKLSFDTFYNSPELIFWLVTAFLTITFVSGVYPAFFLSRFTPAQVLKGKHNSDSSRALRKGLVLFQFSLTSLLVVLVLLINKQTNYMRSQDMGFDKEQLLLFAEDRNRDIGLEAFKAELLQVGGAERITSASGFPGYTRLSSTNLWEVNKTEEESIKALWLYTDHDYIETLGLKLIAGRNFNANGTDRETGVIVNENTINAFGWTIEDAIGKKIAGFTFNDSLPGEIIGVIKDFHISQLRKEIMPLIIRYSTEEKFYIVRITDFALFTTREKLDDVADKFTQSNDFESRFLMDALEEGYSAEIKSGQMLTFFTMLAILIGCSGLYALAAYEGEQRIKELGIRKIMGASTYQLLYLLSKDFLKLLVWSLVFAMPMAYFLGNVWLRGYPYRTSWTPDIFILPSLFVLLLGWLTIISQALKASNLNPVEALRYE